MAKTGQRTINWKAISVMQITNERILPGIHEKLLQRKNEKKGISISEKRKQL